MECSEIRDALLVGGTLDERQAAEHARACEACAALLGDNGVLGQRLAGGAHPESRDLSPEWAFAWQELEQGLAAEHGVLARLRSAPTRWRAALVALLVVAAALVVFWLRRRPDWSSYPLGRLCGAAVAYVVSVAACARLFFGRLLRIERRHGWAFSALLLALPFAFALLPPDGAGAVAAPAPFWLATWRCFISGCVFAAGVTGALWLMDRTRAHSGRALLYAAVAAAACANLVLELHCGSRQPAHLVLGHALIGLFWVSVLFAVERAKAANVRG